MVEGEVARATPAGPQTAIPNLTPQASFGGPFPPYHHQEWRATRFFQGTLTSPPSQGCCEEADSHPHISGQSDPSKPSQGWRSLGQGPPFTDVRHIQGPEGYTLLAHVCISHWCQAMVRIALTLGARGKSMCPARGLLGQELLHTRCRIGPGVHTGAAEPGCAVAWFGGQYHLPLPGAVGAHLLLALCSVIIPGSAENDLYLASAPFWRGPITPSNKTSAWKGQERK